MIRYIGIDPGEHTAIVVLSEEGAILETVRLDRPSPRKSALWQKWGQHHLNVQVALGKVAHLGDCLVLLSNPIHRSAVINYGGALGIVQMLGYVRECDLVEIRDSKVKAALAGHGKATKDEMIAAADKLWPGRDWDEHLADAALAAECVRRGL